MKTVQILEMEEAETKAFAAHLGAGLKAWLGLVPSDAPG